MPTLTASFRASSFGRLVRGFGDDKGGSVALMFALSLVALCLLVGAAIDFGRWLQARHQTIAAMDAAVLAGGRVLQLDSTNVDGARAAASQYYAENVRGRTPVIRDTISFAPADNNTTFIASGNAYISTAFLGLANIPELPLLNAAATSYSKAKIATGGQHNAPVEISLMLDVTGSMGSGTKFADLKTAASDLVNIVINNSVQYNPTRIAIVPFAEGVRLPAGSFSTAVGDPVKIVRKSTGNGNNKKALLYNRSENCVVERTGTNRYTDAAPGSGDYVTPFRNLAATIAAKDGTVSIDGSTTKTAGAAATISWESGSNLSQSQKTNLSNAANTFGSCPLSADDEVMPLSSDKEALKTKIENLDLAGSTAGQIGTAWAWYTLSPNWNALWPADAQAAAYGSNAHKYTILMTDGEYNLQYDADGVQTGSTGAGSAANDDSTTQARSLCTEIKKTGITVYTVGFALGKNQTAIQTLSQCATDSGKAYTADNGAQLQQAFRDIALKISQLYLTQ